MKELIERIEGAEEGSRELDAEILKAVSRGVLDGEYWSIPAYTSSIDAARGLAPKDATFSVDEGPAEMILTGHTEARGRAEVYTLNPDHSGPLSPLVWHIGWGATPALALAAAALKARGE